MPAFARLGKSPFALAVAALMAVGLLLRLWGIKHGLPYVYNLDEGAHFVPKAMAFFSGDLNPHYFINPPAFTYLLYGVFAVYFGGGEAAHHAYAVDQTTVFIVARATSAVLGAAAIGLVVAVGARLYDRRVGLVAGALMAFAFLPVYYSHLALNDVALLVPLLVSLYGAAGVIARDRGIDWVLAGAGLGVAVATKYTAAIVVIPLLVAATYRLLKHDERLRTVAWLAVAGVCALAAFFVANPYGLLSRTEFLADMVKQRGAAGELGKLGQTEASGFRYYLWSLTWGIGWLPAIAAAAGVVLTLRRSCFKGLFLSLFPLAFIVYMGFQGRFFGRWLMPVLPAVMLLAAYAAVALVERVPAEGRSRLVAPLALVAVTAALVIQPLIHSIHVDRVLSRADTRNLARAWLVEHVPAGGKVVIEPIVPQPYLQDPGRPHSITPSGNRWIKYPTGKSTVDNKGRKLPGGRLRIVYVEDFERITRPSLLDDYRGKRYCWVMIGSTQYGRAFVAPKKVPKAIEYYHDLEREGRVAYSVTPYKGGSSPGRPGKGRVPFNFDWSFNYYPMSFERPGPEIIIYKIPRNECGGKMSKSP